MSPVNRSLPDGSKDMRIAGCDVRLTFRQSAGDRWSVEATFRCGVGERRRQESVHSGLCAPVKKRSKRFLGGLAIGSAIMWTVIRRA